MTEHAEHADHASALAVVYQGWHDFQRNLLQAVTPLSPAQWALPVASTHWPIERLVQHIAADRAWWFHVWMGEGGAEVVPIARWDEDGHPQHSATELIDGLAATWTMIEHALARWTVADLGQVFAPPAELTEAERAIFGPSTRQEIIFHVLRHDIHHGGELAGGMGTYHLPTIWAS
jgi:uncharacterized damage-inducible protein DinB